MNSIAWRICTGLGAALIFMSFAYAQDPLGEAVSKLEEATRPPTIKDKLREATIDLAVPKSPAFTALGLTPESVIRPTSPRAFAASVLSGADPRGNIQTGVAVDSAPYLLYAGNTITLEQYRKNYGIRFLSRTKISFAAAKGANAEDEAARLALGLFVTPFDRGDPRADESLLRCFRERLGPVHADAVKVQNNKIAPLVGEGKLEEAIAELEKAIADHEKRARPEADACRDEARKRNWNATAWSLGVAPTWTAPAGNTSDLDWSGAGVWTSIGYGFEEIPGLEDNALLVLHARYRSNELAPDPNGSGAFLEQDTYTLAGQLRMAGFDFRETVGGPDLNFLFEAAYVKEDRKLRPDESLFRYTAGFDYRITDNLYLNLSVGAEDGREDGGNGKFGMAALKWGVSDKPTLHVK